MMAITPLCKGEVYAKKYPPYPRLHLVGMGIFPDSVGTVRGATPPSAYGRMGDCVPGHSGGPWHRRRYRRLRGGSLRAISARIGSNIRRGNLGVLPRIILKKPGRPPGGTAFTQGLFFYLSGKSCSLKNKTNNFLKVIHFSYITYSTP